MTTEREAMTLERQAFEDWYASRQDLWGYPREILRQAWHGALVAHLSRAAEPVYQVMLCTDERYSKNEWREVPYSEFKAAQGKPFHATRILYTRPLESSPDAKEIAFYQWLRNLKCCTFSLSLNEGHAVNYMTLADWIESEPEQYQNVPPEELEKMKALGNDWHLQIYPDTPVGFYKWHAATLDAVIEAAMTCLGAPDR